MNPRKIAILFLALAFPALAFASEPEPEGNQQPSSVTILGETEERSQEVTVRAMTLREILLQRLRERHAAGLDTDILESFVENLSDEALEEIFRQADEEEDFDFGVLTEDEGEDEQEDSTAAEGNSSLLDFFRENKGILAATAAGATAFAAVGYGFAKEDEDFDGDEYEDDDDYEDTETASAAPTDSFFSLGGVAEAWELQGNSAAVDTGAVSRVTNAEIPWYTEPLEEEIYAEPRKVYQMLRNLGYNKIAACGIMGNIMQESSFYTTSRNDYGYLGLFQWDPDDRWPTYESDAQKDGWERLKPYDAERQVNYMFYEATNTRHPEACSPEAMNKMETPEEAASEWMWWFEGVRANEAERRKYAREFFEMF